MNHQSLKELGIFIVQAKAASYVGDGEHAPSCRPGSHDLHFVRGQWSYLDSYFGGRDFIGQEVVYHTGQPVWAMNYYGRILRADLITPEEAGQVIKTSLSHMYQEGRFLGGFEYRHGEFGYHDENDGDLTCFHGWETISRGGDQAYQLVYHGGFIQND